MPHLPYLPHPHWTPFAAAAAALLLAGCAANQPLAPGATQDDLQRAWGRPTATYPLPDGAKRIEYATGPFGRMTWMVDTDAAGRITQTRQVLNEAEFLRVQQAGAIDKDALRRWLGTPGEVNGYWRGGTIWSWRYPTNDCLWFRASLDATGHVVGSGYAVDPRCDGPSDGHN